MPIFNIDLTSVGLIPEGKHTAIVQKLEYQVKTGNAWNKDGTITIAPEETTNYPTDDQRLHFHLHIPGKGVIFHDLYLKESALAFMKNFMTAAGVPFSKNGFNPEDAVGKTLFITITHKDDGYGIKSVISKVEKG